jgi:hypothetical protein
VQKTRTKVSFHTCVAWNFRGVGHLAADNSGKSDLVAAELRRFFSESEVRSAMTVVCTAA